MVTRLSIMLGMQPSQAMGVVVYERVWRSIANAWCMHAALPSGAWQKPKHIQGG
jgi:hypothetical protein